MAKALAKEDMKLDMKSDIISDALDSIGEGMDNEEEQEELYNQVLAEAGVKIEREMVGAGKESLTSNVVNWTTETTCWSRCRWRWIWRCW